MDRSESLGAVSLNDWISKNDQLCTSVWNEEWTRLVKRRDGKGMEQYLSHFCFSLLDLSDQDQVFLARTVFVSAITDLLRLQKHQSNLHPEVLSKAYQLIYQMNQWSTISHFILHIETFAQFFVDELLIQIPFVDCPRLNQALELIQSHLCDRLLSVSWLADQLSISTTHLSNLFRLNMGMNASDYIAKRRINEITYDLVHSSKSLADIRQKYGFVSHSHFIQYFKRHKGKTPLQYRRYVLSMTGQA